MQHSLRSFLRLRLRCPACLANRLAALWAGWQAPQRFSAWLSVPGFAWLDRTDSKQASACWSVSVGGSPLETCGFSPASAGLENATAGSEADRRWLSGQDGDVPRLQPKWKMRQHGGILLDSACRFPARVEFQACFRQKPTAAHFSFTAMAFSCP